MIFAFFIAQMLKTKILPPATCSQIKFTSFTKPSFTIFANSKTSEDINIKTRSGDICNNTGQINPGNVFKL